jgi:hypothetical protein
VAIIAQLGVILIVSSAAVRMPLFVMCRGLIKLFVFSAL